jgi:hypothetical protein
MAAARTKIDSMIERPGVDGLGREWVPFVFRVSGLATDLAPSLTIRGRRLGGLTMSEDGGLDDVAEFFRAVASCSWSFATTASSAASRRV